MDENGNIETKLPRLFKAYSLTDMFSRYYDDNLQINWVCQKRDTPVAPYDVLIAGYEGLRPKARAHAEHFVNELLIEEEVKGLTGFFMKAQGETLRATEVLLPVCCEEMTIYERSGVWNLYANKGYNLSIPVVGYYDDDILSKLRDEEREAVQERASAEEKKVEFILEKDSTIAAL
jgi:hypothetical protein